MKERRIFYLVFFLFVIPFGPVGCKVADWTFDTTKKAYQRIRMPSLQWAVASIMHHDPDVRRKALNVIAYRAKQTGDARLVDIIGTVLNGDPDTGDRPDQSQLVRAAAATALGEIREKKIAIPHLLRAAKGGDNKPVVLIEVMRALGKLGNGRRDAQDTLIEAMQDKNLDADVRREAAVALGQVGDEEAIPPLIDTLVNEKSASLRVALGACDSLQKITGKPFGPEEPENWRLWYAENGNEEIVRAYVEGRLETAKLWPERGPLHQRIPESVTRVFKGLGAELVESGKAVAKGGKEVAKFPVGLAKLTLGAPVKGAKKLLPRRKKDEPGILTKTGRVLVAPFVGAALGVNAIVKVTGKAVAWPFKKIGGLFKRKTEPEEESAPPPEVTETPPEEAAPPPEEVTTPPEEAETPTEVEPTPEQPATPEAEDKPGFLRRVGRVVAAPFVLTGRGVKAIVVVTGKAVAWPFKKIGGIFKRKPKPEEEPAPPPEVNETPPEEAETPTEEVETPPEKADTPTKVEPTPEQPASSEAEDKPGFLRRVGRVAIAPFVLTGRGIKAVVVFTGKAIAWPFKKIGGLFKRED
ncbi:MAG: HEAT repeat domain-containing protein [Planctomycetota bacterium]